jgi:hypothetical protein
MLRFRRTQRQLRVEVASLATLLLVSGALFVILNPSTADTQKDDPTIRRCTGYARAWGFSSLAAETCSHSGRRLRRHFGALLTRSVLAKTNDWCGSSRSPHPPLRYGVTTVGSWAGARPSASCCRTLVSWVSPRPGNPAIHCACRRLLSRSRGSDRPRALPRDDSFALRGFDLPVTERHRSHRGVRWPFAVFRYGSSAHTRLQRRRASIASATRCRELPPLA